MLRSLLFSLLLLSGAFCSLFAQSFSLGCGCPNCPVFIDDGASVEIPINVYSATNNDLADSLQGLCGVRILFGHEYLGDLEMTLQSPSGQSVRLVGSFGFFGTTDFTVWDLIFVPCDTPAMPDPGFSSQWSNEQPWGLYGSYSGNYHPNAGCLEDFDQGPVVGVWKLYVVDGQAIDTGLINDVTLFFCDTAGIMCDPCALVSAAGFAASVDASGWNLLLEDTSENAVVYILHFGDSTSFAGNAMPTHHTYSDTGAFLVQLIVSNGCDYDTTEQWVYIPGSLPQAAFFVNPNSGCIPLTAFFTVYHEYYVDTWHWLLPGGAPSESYDKNPVVQYDLPGIFPVTLIISNALGNDTLTDTVTVLTLFSPNPSFSVVVQGDTIICTNTSTGELYDFQWFVNGNLVSEDSNLVFIAQASGFYVVTLWASNICGAFFAEDSVLVEIVGSKVLEQVLPNLTLSPNPSTGLVYLEILGREHQTIELQVFETTGRQVFEEKIQLLPGKNTCELDLRALPNGFYTVRLKTRSGEKTIQFVLQR